MLKYLLLILFCLFSCSNSDNTIRIKNTIELKDANVRSSYITKGKKSKIIGKVKSGLKFKIIDVYGDWIKVSYLKKNKTVEGFIYSQLLENYRKDFTIVLGLGCTLRSKPTTKSKPVCFIPANENVKIEDIIITWYKIKTEKLTGWIYKDYIVNKKVD